MSCRDKPIGVGDVAFAPRRRYNIDRIGVAYPDPFAYFELRSDIRKPANTT